MELKQRAKSKLLDSKKAKQITQIGKETRIQETRIHRTQAGVVISKSSGVAYKISYNDNKGVVGKLSCMRVDGKVCPAWTYQKGLKFPCKHIHQLIAEQPQKLSPEFLKEFRVDVRNAWREEEGNRTHGGGNL